MWIADTVGWTDGWTDGQTNEWMDCVPFSGTRVNARGYDERNAAQRKKDTDDCYG